MPQKTRKKAKVQKTAAKKSVVKKAIAKKPVAKKASAKKVVAKKAMKKIAVKKSAAKKPVKKAIAKKSTVKAVKKLVAKKPIKLAAKAQALKAQAAKKPVQKPAVKVQAKAQAKAQVVAKSAPAAAKPVAAKPQAKTAPVAKSVYKVGCHVVYPTHGVGKIVAEETQMIGDVELRMLVISFEKDKMTLRVPVHRATAAGLRPVSTADQMKKVFATLKSRARTSRGMWSRRAQEYEAKINSGNIFSIAEVVRDLHQNVDQSERSYSERMIYESALSRLVGELAAAESTDHKVATDKLMKLLRGKVAAAQAAALTKEAA
jgi:CarD family transcriptional regulator